MRILATGNQLMRDRSSTRLVLQAPPRSLQAGFTLIEILVAITIISILMSVAVVNIPNHDDRNWKNNLNHLVTTMNVAHEESLLNGQALYLKIDSNGWSFYRVDSLGMKLGQDIANPNASDIKNTYMNPQSQTQLKGLPSIYKAQSWNQPVAMNPIEIILGDELFNASLAIPITQGDRVATISRNRYGQFSVVHQ